MQMDYKYCPRCGSQYDKRVGLQNYACSNCKSVIYLNSKPTASAIIADGDSILLGKRRIEPSKGKWDVIGGFLNLGERPEDGAKREAKEETGLNIELERMLGFFMDTYETTGDKTLNICFVARVNGGVLKPGDDINELRWFSVDQIPKDLAFKNGVDMVNVWRKALKSNSS